MPDPYRLGRLGGPLLPAPGQEPAAAVPPGEGEGPEEPYEVHDRQGDRRPLLAGALLLMTFVSTTFAGALRQISAPEAGGSPVRELLAALRHLPAGLSFSLPLCAILVCHELGHYLAARHHRVPVSLPYFIPFPLSVIGTLGAVIGLRAEVRSRDALFDIGASGPLFGLVLALPILCVGLSWSGVGPVRPGDAIEGQSLLYLLLKYLIKGAILPGVVGGQALDVQLHPVAFAGWVGLLVTMINLIPIGQLDGGHVAAAYFGKDHARRSRLLHRGLLCLAGGTAAYVTWLGRHGVGPARPLREAAAAGVAAALPWLIWAGALLVMRRLSGGQWHPEVNPGPLSPWRRGLGIMLFVLMGLLFMPYIMREAT